MPGPRPIRSTPRVEPAPVLVIQHVPWEGPHRIAAALEGLPLVRRRPLDGEPLPDPAGLSGAVLMGGPMGVEDDHLHPELAGERLWVEAALFQGLPLLGVCLGSQLIAHALGSPVRRGEAPEIGWAPIEVSEPADPVVGALAPAAQVLHWHGEVFDLPPGATQLARSAHTVCQAFRHGDAWGLLFHAEADAALVERWLVEPGMLAEAEAALGPGAEERLRAGAAEHGPALTAASTPGFAAFAARAAARRAELAA